MKETLVSIAIKFGTKEITDDEARVLLKESNEFEPLLIKSGSEDTVWSIDDGNSWLDVESEVVYKKLITRDRLKILKSIHREVRG